MREEPLRDASAHASEEALLERYVEKPSPLRDWLEAKIRRAPWWCISFLVHIVALLVLWSWPMEGKAQPPEETPVVLGKFEEPIIEDPPPIVPSPIDPDVDRDDFDIKDFAELTPKNELPDELPKPMEPGEKQGGDQTPEPPMPGETPKIGPIDPVLPPVKPPTRGPDVGPRDLWTLIDPPPTKPPIVIRPPGLDNLTAALYWLMRAQEKDGSWDAKRWEGANSYRVGMTGLALLAFEGAGFTHTKGKTFRQVVTAGLDWLRKSQRDDGSFPWEVFYEQGIATMAVCEAYGLTEDPRLRPMAQRAVDYIVKLQPEHGGFRYQGAVPMGEGDLSVTGWQIMALKSALLANLRVPPEAIEHSRVFLKNTLRDYGASSYLAANKEAGSLAMTSVGLLCRLFLNEGGAYAGEILQAATYLVQKENPELKRPANGASKELVTDLYYTYYSSLAMFMIGGRDSEYWKAWMAMYLEPLKAAQVHATRDAQGRFVKGSYEPARHKWGDRGGRVFTTALAALCFEAPFRFLPSTR